MALRLLLLGIAVATSAAMMLAPNINLPAVHDQSKNTSLAVLAGMNSTNLTSSTCPSLTDKMDSLLETLEYEFDLEGVRKDIPVKNKLVLAVIELFGLGLFGIDRCYIGQTCLGFVKGLTLGALGVWLALDFFAVVITCLSFSKNLNALGMRANFGPDKYNMVAFLASVIILGFLIILASIAVHGGERKWAVLKGKSPEELLTIFSTLDLNLDGVLTKHELVLGMQRLGCTLTEHDIDAMISQADVSGDGTITFVEFKAFAGSL